MVFRRRFRRVFRRRGAARRSRKSTGRKSNYVRRGTKSKPSVVSFSKTNYVPDIYRTKLTYVQTINRSNATPPDIHVFRGNSAFDPDFGIGGAQPNGYDQLSSLYRAYRVNASKCKVQFLSTATSNAGFIQFVLFPAEAASFVAAMSSDAAAGVRYAKSKIVGTSSGMGKATLSGYMSTRKVLGTNYDTNIANTGSNPSAAWNWYIHASSLTANLGVDYTMVVKMTYYIDFVFPIQLAQS